MPTGCARRGGGTNPWRRRRAAQCDLPLRGSPPRCGTSPRRRRKPGALQREHGKPLRHGAGAGETARPRKPARRRIKGRARRTSVLEAGGGEAEAEDVFRKGAREGQVAVPQRQNGEPAAERGPMDLPWVGQRAARRVALLRPRVGERQAPVVPCHRMGADAAPAAHAAQGVLGDKHGHVHIVGWRPGRHEGAQDNWRIATPPLTIRQRRATRRTLTRPFRRARPAATHRRLECARAVRQPRCAR